MRSNEEIEKKIEKMREMLYIIEKSEKDDSSAILQKAGLMAGIAALEWAWGSKEVSDDLIL